MNIFQSLAISLGLGLLVGLQREWRQSEVAGIRTFGLTTLFGTLTVLVTGPGRDWAIAGGLVSLSILLLVANVAKLKNGQNDPGMTTEIAVLLMFGVGVAIGVGLTGPAVVTGGLVAVLLQWKQGLHVVVRRLGERDVRTVMQLALIGLVILPALPDESYGPYQVLNPFRIWLMVVLIVGISVAAYLAYLLLGARVGPLLGGVLGGLISSTATTVSAARQSQSSPGASHVSAVVVVVASLIVNVRVLIEIGVAAPRLLPAAAPPFIIIMVLMGIAAGRHYRRLRPVEIAPPPEENPAQLRAAILFGLLYAVVLLLVAAAKERFGHEALYLLAVLSGLTDVDAITLSAARLFTDGTIAAGIAWRVALLATLSNLAFKLGVIAALGSRALLRSCTVTFALTIAVGAALLISWPDDGTGSPGMGRPVQEVPLVPDKFR